MKAKRINENIDFERGKNTKEALKLGVNRFNNYKDYVVAELNKHQLDEDDFWEFYYEMMDTWDKDELIEAALENLEHAPIQYQIDNLKGSIIEFIEGKEDGTIS